MKKQILTLLTIAMLTFSAASTASALTINSGATEVGNIDSLMAYTVLADSSPADENTWAAPIVFSQDGVVVNFTEQTPSTESLWIATNQAGVYAFQLSGGNDYFILKSGDLFNGKPTTQPAGANQYEHFLFRNNVQDSWAVIELNSLIGDNDPTTYFTSFNVNTGKISHVTTEDNTTPVPEPGTMVLLGAGMLGLAIFGKRRMNKDA